jgi:hypothetical protein
MTGKQTAVMWLGLLLIAVRLFTTDQWESLWGTVKTGGNPGGVSVNSGSSNPASGAPSAPGAPSQAPLLSPTGNRPL